MAEGRRSVTLTLAQLSPVDGDPAANAERARILIDSSPGSNVVVLPELFLSGYDPERAAECVTALDGPEIGSIGIACAGARRAAIVGFAEPLDGGGVANSLVCVDEVGAIAAVYRKCQLYGELERRAFEPGDELVLAEIAGIKVGPQICYDMEFPEPSRALARAGAELLITCSANMHPYASCHEVAARARAMENQLPHVYVNRVGSQAGLEFVGRSMAVDPEGSAIFEAGEDESVSKVEITLHPDLGQDDSYLEQLRPDLRVAASSRF